MGTKFEDPIIPWGVAGSTFRLVLAAISTALMLCVTVLLYDMNAPVRSRPFVYGPLTVMPCIWVVIAAGLVRRRPGPAAWAVTILALAVLLLSLLSLDDIYRQWLSVRFGRVRRLTTGPWSEAVIWLQYPLGLLAVLFGAAGWWDGRRREPREGEE